MKNLNNILIRHVRSMDVAFLAKTTELKGKELSVEGYWVNLGQVSPFILSTKETIRIPVDDVLDNKWKKFNTVVSTNSKVYRDWNNWCNLTK